MNLEDLRKLDKKYAQAIADYLLKRIESDECLKEKLETTTKTLKGCLAYIKSEARKQAEDNVAVIMDSEVYEWAVHYFLEDSLNNEPKKENKTESKPKKEETPKVEELVQTEKVETLFGEEEITKEKKKSTPKAPKVKKDIKEDFQEQLTLFDF